MHEKINRMLKNIKLNRPLILNITNFVTMDFVANGLLSLGASPIMSQAKEEIEDLVSHSSAVVINPGTLDENFTSLCTHTANLANSLNLPIILDPVGAGATRYRTAFNKTLIKKFNFSIIRGNASEIMALCEQQNTIKGVDSSIDSHLAINAAKSLSKCYNSTIVISGKTDIVIYHDSHTQLDRGSHLMPSITGSGCLLSAVVAAFHSLEKNCFEAANMATLFYGICGEIAENKSNGPGSFKINFLDALSLFLEKNSNDKC